MSGAARGAVCAVLLVLAPSENECQAAPSRKNTPIAQALRLRDQFQHEAALRVLAQAAARPALPPEQMVALELMNGVLLCETEQFELAEQAFHKALSIQPDATIDLDVAPKITELLDTVRQQVKAPIPVEPAPPPPPPPPPPTGGEVTVVHPPVGLRERLAAYRVPVAIAGGGLAVVGALSWARANSLAGQLRAGDASITSREQLDATIQRGRTFETAGWVLMGVGVAATVGSLVLLPSGPTPSLGAAPTPGGAQISLLWKTP